MSYRQVAESIRVCKAMPTKKGDIITNLIRPEKTSQYQIVYLLYSPSNKQRLSDEDFREIYYLLTDLYPSEVDSATDVIDLLCDLSTATKTTASINRIYEITHKILEIHTDNESVAYSLTNVIKRISKEDLRIFLHRLSNRGSIISRYDVIKGIARANGVLVRHVRKASFLIGLERVCERLSRDEEITSIIKPPLGMPLIIPSPAIVKNIDDIPFGETLVEIPEGMRYTIHVLDDSIKLFDATGIENEVDENTMSMMQSMKLKKGIYLAEYAAGRDIEWKIVDYLTPKDDTMPFKHRRNKLDIPKWAIKEMVSINDAKYYLEHTGIDRVGILWNSNGILTYESTIYESALVNPKKVHKSVFEVLGGVYIKQEAHSRPRLSKWRIGVRDGDDIYSVGLVDIEESLSLMRFVNPHKIKDGEQVSLNSPLYVNVNVISSGWGDYGAYVQGIIVSVAEQAGRKDCVSIDELEALNKRWDNNGGID